MLAFERPLIIGGTGFLGSRLFAFISRLSQSAMATSRVATPALLPLPLEDGRAVHDLIVEQRPTTVVFAAAMADVDACEERREESRAVNVAAPLAAARACAKIGARMIHYSTSYVFDGTAGPYREDDPTGPIMAYGADKLAGEHCVLDACPRSIVIRTSQLFDGPAPVAGFPAHIAADSAAGRRTYAWDDQYNTPTHVADLIGGTCDLAMAGATGVFHLAGPETLSRYEAARSAARGMGLDPDNCVGVGQGRKTGTRPVHAGLAIQRARETIGYAPQTIEDGLALRTLVSRSSAG